VKRDRENVNALRTQGWRVLIVWECELRDTDRLLEKLKRAITDGGPFFQNDMFPVQMAAEAPESYEVSKEKSSG